MKPITGEPLPSMRVIVCAYLCVCGAHISYVHIVQRGNISHLHRDARPPSVNDSEMEVALRAGKTVKQPRWSNNQMSKSC